MFIVIHTVKGFGIVNKAEVDVFLELSHFSMIQWMLSGNSQGPPRTPEELQQIHVGVEWWLCGAGATLGRHPMSKGKGEAPATWKEWRDCI